MQIQPLEIIVNADEPKTDAERRLWMSRRQAIIMELGAIEDYLGMPRSIVPRRQREQERDERKAG